MTCESDPAGLPRVLVVDDEDVLRRELIALLEEEGFDVVGEAANGLAAVNACGQMEIDVVLMDLRMPEMNGLDAARASAVPSARPRWCFCRLRRSCAEGDRGRGGRVRVPRQGLPGRRHSRSAPARRAQTVRTRCLSAS